MEDRQTPQSYGLRATSSRQGLHVFALQVCPATNPSRKDFRGFGGAHVVHASALQLIKDGPDKCGQDGHALLPLYRGRRF